MTTVHILPVGEEIAGPVSLHHDFETDPHDAEVSLSQAYGDDPTSNDADVITFHPDRIPALIKELTELSNIWRYTQNTKLRRSHDDITKGDW